DEPVIHWIRPRSRSGVTVYHPGVNPIVIDRFTYRRLGVGETTAGSNGAALLLGKSSTLLSRWCLIETPTTRVSTTKMTRRCSRGVRTNIANSRFISSRRKSDPPGQPLGSLPA